MTSILFFIGGLVDFSKLNETDVREEIIAPFIRELGYKSASEHNVLREQSLRYPRVFLGRKNAQRDPVLRGKADYILEAGGKVRWVIEAKSPTSMLDLAEIEQAWTYASHPEVCAVYFVLCNGKRLLVFQTSRGPNANALLSFDYEQFNEPKTKLILAGVLAPQSILRDYPDFVVDVEEPLGQGLRSIARITGGYIRYDKSTLEMPAIYEMLVSIVSGAVERDSEHKLVAFLESRAPTRSVQDLIDRMGLASFEMVSDDATISSDPANPTVFTYQKTVVFREGEELTDINTWQKIKLPGPMEIQLTATASGFLEGNKFHGKFVNDMMLMSTVPITVVGTFCLFVA